MSLDNIWIIPVIIILFVIFMGIAFLIDYFFSGDSGAMVIVIIGFYFFAASYCLNYLFPEKEEPKDYYQIEGEAEVENFDDAKVGEITYCPIVNEHPACAYGLLTKTLRESAKARGRQPINVDPYGWPEKNSKVKIFALKDVKGSKNYTGYMWNRSHLIADSLGGEPIKENLIPGTRTQNVGSTQIDGEYAGGMAYAERKARIYLDEQKDDSCPLLYAVVPQYENKKIPHTVTIHMKNCNGSINEKIVVDNSANNFVIDYNTGEFDTTK